MGRLIYAANISLDGFVEDDGVVRLVRAGRGPACVLERARAAHRHVALRTTHVRGDARVGERRLVDERAPGGSRVHAGIWRDADKVVYSTSLTDVSTARTRIERQFEPEAVRRLKETSASDLSIGGAGIAAEAFRHGLVDECVLLVCPVTVGGGKPALPRGVRLDLQLVDHRRLGNGVVYVRHAVRHPA